MRDPRGPLLERRVDQAVIRIIADLRIKAVPDEVLRRPLDRLHVHAAREVEILVEKFSVAMLFRRPASGPQRPGIVTGSRLVLEGVGTVKPGLVRRQRLFGDDIAHQHDQQFIGEILGVLPKGLHARMYDVVRVGKEKLMGEVRGG